METCIGAEKIIILYDNPGDFPVTDFGDERIIVLKKPIEVDLIVSYFTD